MLVVRNISGQMIKSPGHGGHSKFLSCPLRGPVPIWPICFIFVTIIVHDVTMCRDPFSGQTVIWSKVKVTSLIWKEGHRVIWRFYHVRSVASSLFDQRSKVKFTWVVWSFCHVRYVTSSVFDRITSYVAYIQHVRERCVVHHFQDVRSMVKVMCVICSSSF